jgi:hypothetical protein
MCAGIDLSPALLSQGFDATNIIEQIETSCNRGDGVAKIPEDARQKLESVGKILNIGWVGDGAAKEANIICPRSSSCPRDRHCVGASASQLKPQVEKIRENVLSNAFH